MKLRLIRHATLLVDYNGQRFVVDPMLDDAEARPAIENSPNPRMNPLVPLPLPADEALAGVNGVLITHTHSDHWDTTGAKLLAKQLPLFTQPEDGAKFRAQGFSNLQPVQACFIGRGLRFGAPEASMALEKSARQWRRFQDSSCKQWENRPCTLPATPSSAKKCWARCGSSGPPWWW